MSLDIIDLRVLTESGTELEKRYARKILPVRKHGNFLLCSLLIGNTAVNSALSIVSSSIFGGVYGLISSTVVILYIGEIIPQSICHRYGLAIGAYAMPFVKAFMLITGIIAYPTAKALDYFLGGVPATRYNKSQLRSLLSIHGEGKEALAAAASAGGGDVENPPDLPGNVGAEYHVVDSKSEYVVGNNDDNQAPTLVGGGSAGTPATTASSKEASDGAPHVVDATQASTADLERIDREAPAKRKRGFLPVWLGGRRGRRNLDAGGGSASRSGRKGDSLEARGGGHGSQASDGDVKSNDGGGDGEGCDDDGGGDSKRKTPKSSSKSHRGYRDKDSHHNHQRSGDKDRKKGKEKESEAKEHAPLTANEITLLDGAFQFSQKTVVSVMTEVKDVFMLDADMLLHFDNLLLIFQSGHSRIPVYAGSRDNIFGVLFAKDLILLDPEDCVPIKYVLSFFNRTLLLVYATTPLDEMLNIFKRGGGHLALVQRVSEKGTPEQTHETLGVCTLEDLIEELIGEDIVDETDVYADNVNRRRVRRMRLLDPEILKMFDHNKSEMRLSDKERKVVAAYLAAHFAAFSPARVTSAVLYDLLCDAAIIEWPELTVEESEQARLNGTCGVSEDGDDALASGEESDTTNETQSRRPSTPVTEPAVRFVSGANGDAKSNIIPDEKPAKTPTSITIYKRGVTSQDAFLVISGRLEITAGDDGFVSEAGPWTLLGMRALTDDLYAPDFTAQVSERPARLLRTSRRLYRKMMRYSKGGDSIASQSFEAIASLALQVPTSSSTADVAKPVVVGMRAKSRGREMTYGELRVPPKTRGMLADGAKVGPFDHRRAKSEDQSMMDALLSEDADIFESNNTDPNLGGS